MSDKTKDVKRTERGWIGHFIGGADCMYHRNTLLEYGDKMIVVSTIGQYMPSNKRKEYWHSGKLDFEMIGRDRYFETMAFVADKKDKYHDSTGQQVYFNSKWEINDIDGELEADKMHEDVVAELSQHLVNDTLNIDTYGD